MTRPWAPERVDDAASGALIHEEGDAISSSAPGEEEEGVVDAGETPGQHDSASIAP